MIPEATLFDDTGREAAIDTLHAATAIYTAEPVVEAMLDGLDWPNGSHRLVDPSAGDGMFVGKALERLLAAEPDAPAGRILSILEGWELHPHACAEARGRLTRLLVAHGRSDAEAKAIAAGCVHNKDFLTQGPTGKVYSKIVGNPPYLRWTGVPDILRTEYNAVVPGYATADLLHSFLDRCARALADDGEIVLVTADRWLFNEHAGQLRAVLGQSLGISQLQRLDPRSTFYRPKLRRAGSPPRIHPVCVGLSPAVRAQTPLSSAPIYPGAETDRFKNCTRTLGDVAQVRIAPWLGTPGIFFVTADQAARFPAECLVPAVDTDDIKGGVLQFPRRFALRTSPDVEPPAAVLEHITREIHRMAPRGRQNPMWVPPERWQSLDLSRPCLLVPRIARTPVAVRVPANVLPINHNLSIVAGDETTLEAVETFLAGSHAREWVETFAPRLENGYFSLTTKLLRSMPVDF